MFSTHFISPNIIPNYSQILVILPTRKIQKERTGFNLIFSFETLKSQPAEGEAIWFYQWTKLCLEWVSNARTKRRCFETGMIIKFQRSCLCVETTKPVASHSMDLELNIGRVSCAVPTWKSTEKEHFCPARRKPVDAHPANILLILWIYACSILAQC